MDTPDTPLEQLSLFPTEKRCSKCGEIKPLAAFSRHKKGKDGLNWWCRACNAAYCRAHHQAHSEAMNARSRERAARERQTRPETRAERDLRLRAGGLGHCGLCDQVKPLSEFGRLGKRPHGFTTQCRSCRNARARGYRKANPEHARTWERAWCRANPEKVRHTWRRYERRLREERPEAYRARNSRRYYRYKAYRAAYCKRWIAAHPETNRRYKREWNHRHLEYVAANQQSRRARLRRIPGSFSVADIRLIYDLQRGRCAYCLVELHRRFHRDHMTPVSRSGCTNDIGNICLTCAACNHAKGTRTAGEYMALLIRARRALRAQAAT